MSAKTYIYVIKAEGYGYKIGIANRPKERLSQLRVGLPVEFTLMSCQEVDAVRALRVEASLHRRYGDNWLRGEWFSLPDKFDEAGFVKDVMLSAMLFDKFKRTADGYNKIWRRLNPSKCIEAD